MGRTLHYRVLAPEAIPPEALATIASVVRAMNKRFTWTCEPLGFSVPEPSMPRAGRESEPFDCFPLRAEGFTKVASDEWNACLTIRFVTWLSRMLPDATVTLLDEGRYIPAHHVMLESGKMTIDRIRLANVLGRIEGRDDRGAIGIFWINIAAALNGHFFGSIRAADYADRQEIQGLEIPKRDLGHMSLEEVADRIVFPWDAQPRPWDAEKRA